MKPVEYRPCPDCDGWLMLYGNELSGETGELVAKRWACTVCSNTDRVKV